MEVAVLQRSNKAVVERLRRLETAGEEGDYDSVPRWPQGDARAGSSPGGDRASTPGSGQGNLMSETRDDLLQGIRAMDDSIQTLKEEMGKLMSVYEYARPEESVVRLEPAADMAGDSCRVEVVEAGGGGSAGETSPAPLTPEAPEPGAGEGPGEEATPWSGRAVVTTQEEEAGLEVTLPTPRLARKVEVEDSLYNVELGVYHENEISGQPTSSPVPPKNAFRTNRMKNSKSIRKVPSMSAVRPEEPEEEQEEQEEPEEPEPPYESLAYSGAGDREAWDRNSVTPEVTIELTRTEDTSDTVSAEEGAGADRGDRTIDDFLEEGEGPGPEEREGGLESLLARAGGLSTWEDLEGLGDPAGLPPPLLLQENLRCCSRGGTS
jgi:hypothetical protein